MDNTYKLLAKRIDSQACSFYAYLQQFMLDELSWKAINMLSEQCNVYIFSGVIRNFLLGYIENRDLDIVIDNTQPIKLPFSILKRLEWRKNSFGGIKLRINSLIIDLWKLEDTWGIVNEKKSLSPESLIESAFFNFSAIVFYFNERRFIYGNAFLSFLNSYKMDVVYSKNPNIPLCIINIIYYHDRYGFGISKGLCLWFMKNYNPNFDYRSIQIKHWGHVKYNNRIIANYNAFISTEYCRHQG